MFFFYIYKFTIFLHKTTSYFFLKLLNDSFSSVKRLWCAAVDSASAHMKDHPASRKHSPPQFSFTWIKREKLKIQKNESPDLSKLLPVWEELNQLVYPSIRHPPAIQPVSTECYYHPILSCYRNRLLYYCVILSYYRVVIVSLCYHFITLLSYCHVMVVMCLSCYCYYLFSFYCYYVLILLLCHCYYHVILWYVDMLLFSLYYVIMLSYHVIVL